MGRYLEEFDTGMRFESHARTITEAHVVAFAGLTGDFNPVHMDEAFARAQVFGARIAHGPLLLGMSFGLLTHHDLFDGTVLALRRIEWEFTAPVKLGDTVRLVAEVTEVSPHPKQADRGRVSMRATYYNQDAVAVSRGAWTLVVRRKPA